MSFFYLAAPYSGQAGSQRYREEIQSRRAGKINRIAARLIRDRGIMLFSPISHGHSIHRAARQWGIDLPYSYWIDLSFIMIERSQGMIVVPLEGWENSPGVSAEIELAKQLSKPIEILEGI